MRHCWQPAAAVMRSCSVSFAIDLPNLRNRAQARERRSAVNLKFLSYARQARVGTSNSIIKITSAPVIPKFASGAPRMLANFGIGALERFAKWLSQTLRRHARTCSGHPGLSCRKQDVDGRDEPGHDVEPWST